ncbi:MAG: PaaI family thioesterase [Deltaproteobacteria bacterium]|nr:PaaI family thioesterase [Deltaproteobacteria bacterium]
MDFADFIQSMTDGWRTVMGVRFLRATADEVIAELVVADVHRQPLGMVHGGVYAGLIESVASVGASLYAMQDGRYAVGLENHTSFLHAVREGKLRAVAHPMSRGRRTHVWRADVLDDGERVVATGTVRLIVVERGSPLGGEPAEVTR